MTNFICKAIVATSCIAGTSGFQLNQDSDQSSNQCPSWVQYASTDPTKYVFSEEEWGGKPMSEIGGSNGMGWVGNNKSGGSGALTAATTTACVWEASCEAKLTGSELTTCKKNCPIALGIAFNESGWHPKAQSYDGIGRGLFQWGGHAVPACSRGFVGADCTATPTVEGNSVTVEDCNAFNPLLNAMMTIVDTKGDHVTNGGSNWLPKGNPWWSCNNGSILQYSESKGQALQACMAATGNEASFFNTKNDCTVGPAASAYVTQADIDQYCNGGPAPPPAPSCSGAGDKGCPSYLCPYANTPVSGKCSCGTSWSDADHRSPNVACTN